jgi:hypothetical protein
LRNYLKPGAIQGVQPGQFRVPDELTSHLPVYHIDSRDEQLHVLGRDLISYHRPIGVLGLSLLDVPGKRQPYRCVQWIVMCKVLI